MQNKTTKTSSNFEERVFFIRLKSSQNQDFNLKNNPHFVKIIKQEYATKYLETLNIEPTQKNINMILKKYPLENCDITAGWNSSNSFSLLIPQMRGSMQIP